MQTGRREFFSRMARETLVTAGQLVGATSMLRQSVLLSVDDEPPVAPGERPSVAPIHPATVPLPPPYRVAEDSLLILDQRGFPLASSEFVARTVDDVIAAIQVRFVRGSLGIAEVAAYGIWLAARSIRGITSRHVRDAMVTDAARRLRLASPNVAATGWAIDEMLRRYHLARADGTETGASEVDRLRECADSIAAEILADTKRIGDTGAAALEQPSGRPIEMLTLDSTGALSGGLGTAFAMIRAMAKQGRDMHVWILETRPFHSGSRLGALELAALGIPATLVVDAASASILSTGPIDAVLAGADLIAADGSAVGVVGTAGVATLAQAAGVPFWILASTKSIDLRVPTGVVLSVDQGSYSAVTPMMHEPWQPGGSVASRGPLQDVTSPDLIGAIVTEMGIAGQPLERGIIHAIGGKR